MILLDQIVNIVMVCLHVLKSGYSYMGDYGQQQFIRTTSNLNERKHWGKLRKTIMDA